MWAGEAGACMKCSACGVAVHAAERACPLCGAFIPPHHPAAAGPTPGGWTASGTRARTAHVRTMSGGARGHRPLHRLAPLVGVAILIVALGFLVGRLLLDSGSTTATVADTQQGVAEPQAHTPQASVDPGPAAASVRAPDSPSRTDASPQSDGPSASFRVGEWILVLESLDVGTYTLRQAVSRASELGPVVVVDSSRMPGLRPGYWAVVSSTSYPSRKAAASHCGDHGRKASGACYPRLVTG